MPDTPQTFSHFPHIPPPVNVRLVTLAPTPCPYLPDRMSTSRAIVASSVDPHIYHDFMNAGFRRSGLMLYQPVCNRCRECRQIRVPVGTFKPSRSQRRTLKRNADLQVEVAAPSPTREKFEIYQRYVFQWHAHEKPSTWEEFSDFLYEFPSTSIEFVYRLGDRVVAAGCAMCANPHLVASTSISIRSSLHDRSVRSARW